MHGRFSKEDPDVISERNSVEFSEGIPEIFLKNLWRKSHSQKLFVRMRAQKNRKLIKDILRAHIKKKLEECGRKESLNIFYKETLEKFLK